MSDELARDPLLPWQSTPLRLGHCTTEQCASLLAAPQSIVLLPVGSTEPHGPHLPLCTDALLAEESLLRATVQLRAQGMSAAVAPAIAYGVTDYAAGFAGAISIDRAALVGYLVAVCVGLRRAGFSLVCVSNHHLEPDHVTAVAEACARAEESVGAVVFANQLTKRWGRTLSDEFKRGACHAGSYESSLVLAADASLVDEARRLALPDIDVSLSQAIRDGKTNFRQMGLRQAYTGEPQNASLAEGEQLYQRLTEMVVTECVEALQRVRP
jgi:creatinine amidohydrolase